MNALGIGGAVPRREDARLVRGAGTFVGNLDLPGLLDCAFARSPLAHGTLAGLHLDAALAAPGVVAAFGAADLDLADIPAPTQPVAAAVPGSMARPPLARDRVRYVGEAVAVVVASGAYAAADAVELVDADLEALPAASDVEAALAGDALLFPDAGTNVAATSRAGAEAGGTGTSWPVTAEVLVDHPRLAAAPIEPLGLVARPEPGGGLTVWIGHQAPHRLRALLGRLLGLDEQAIRVCVPDVGGGFGHKNAFYPEYAVVAACALRLDRPARWLATRSENLVVGTHGRAQRHRAWIGGDRDGRVRSLRVDVVGELGAYPHNGALTPVTSGSMAPGPYAIDRVEVSVTTVVTNRAPTGAYRGAGRPEATLTLERAIDAFAHAAGLDPVAVRRRNFVPPNATPHDSPTGLRYDSGDYAAALDKALEHVDLPAVRAEQARRLAGTGPLVGVGVGAFVERAGGAPDSSEYGRVELTAAGGFVVRVGSAAAGQGHETTWSQVVADVFGLDDLDRVRVVTGDTAEVAAGTGSFGSRSTQVAGSAVLRCARRLHERVATVAGGLLECAPADVVVAGAAASVRGDPGATVTLGDVARAAAADGTELADEEEYAPGARTFPYGVYVAVVEVDRDTGLVTVRDLVAVDDCGTVVNPVIVEGQVHGSLAQGLGQALYEEFVYDGDGQPLTSTLVDYTLPGAPDVPAFTTDRTVTPSPVNPLGAKGTGEAGCIGAPPAVVGAVLDALRPLGVTDIGVPMTPARVWRAMRAAARG